MITRYPGSHIVVHSLDHISAQKPLTIKLARSPSQNYDADGSRIGLHGRAQGPSIVRLLWVELKNSGLLNRQVTRHQYILLLSMFHGISHFSFQTLLSGF